MGVRDTSTTPPLDMAHVLFTDIVAYSQAPMDEQTRLIERLQQIVRDTAEFGRAQKRHQLLRLPTGDGMSLVFFGDAEAPARCALEISHALRAHPDLKLRMGIHTGPVQRIEDINAHRNVAGGGINLAQRVMDCGDAGHILVSKSVADVLAEMSSWKVMLHDLGEAEVKHGVRVHLYNLYTDEVGNAELPQKLYMAQKTAATVHSKAKRKKFGLVVVAAGGIAALAIGGYLYPRRAHALTDKDTVILAGFTNTTGDPVFDGTLRRGLSVQLEQSPFLSIIPDQQIEQTLSLMGQKPDAKLTPEIARELCLRTASAAVLGGSIAQIGTQYLLTLKAVNCSSGGTLASTEAEASDKNHVLDALGKTASDIRNKLGESLSIVQKFDTPLEQATTPSLDALKALSSGEQVAVTKGSAAAIPFFKHATELDPNFALAYALLGRMYGDIKEYSLSADFTRKAYELRGRTSEQEKYFISASFHSVVTGNMKNAEQTCELWVKAYPRTPVPHMFLTGLIYPVLGEYERGVEEGREAVRLNPDSPVSHSILMLSYITLNHFDEAKAAYEQALQRKLDRPLFHYNLYEIAFLQNDTAGMLQQVTWSAGKPGVEDELLGLEANTAAYSGRLREAREFSRRAVDSAERADQKETAANYSAVSGLREAMFGNAEEARRRITFALGRTTGRDEEYCAALALAYAGDYKQLQTLTDDLGKRFPEATIVQFNYLPTLRAKLAVSRGSGSQAVENLRAATPYELGQTTSSTYGWTALYPIYVRGEAYLTAHQGSEAAAEFQKILDHRGVVVNEPIGALAHLQIGRAYAMQGDTAKARAAYQDFLTLWKEADPDIPVLVAAKAEYEKLK